MNNMFKIKKSKAKPEPRRAKGKYIVDETFMKNIKAEYKNLVESKAIDKKEKSLNKSFKKDIVDIEKSLNLIPRSHSIDKFYKKCLRVLILGIFINVAVVLLIMLSGYFTSKDSNTFIFNMIVFTIASILSTIGSTFIYKRYIYDRVHRDFTIKRYDQIIKQSDAHKNIIMTTMEIQLNKPKPKKEEFIKKEFEGNTVDEIEISAKDKRKSKIKELKKEYKHIKHIKNK